MKKSKRMLELSGLLIEGKTLDDYYNEVFAAFETKYNITSNQIGGLGFDNSKNGINVYVHQGSKAGEYLYNIKTKKITKK